MFDTARAVLHSFEETGFTPVGPILVINDFNRELKTALPECEFWSPEESCSPPLRKFQIIVVFTPKQKEESKALAAQALTLAETDGTVILAAHNDAGGKTLKKLLIEFGVPVSDHSKHKCRVAWTHQPQLAAKIMLDEALVQGGIQQRADGLWSQPGLFSWDRLDAGTDALLHHLPFAIKGIGADFGCGIGVIGSRILQRHKEVEKLICLDRDARALQCCEKNLTTLAGRFETRRADLTQALDLPKLDFIVMNPPFHTGKKQSVAIGQAFIRNASATLKKSGVFVFVANVHLPYEQTVMENFSFNRVLSEENGFKIIEAVK